MNGHDEHDEATLSVVASGLRRQASTCVMPAASTVLLAAAVYAELCAHQVALRAAGGILLDAVGDIEATAAVLLAGVGNPTDPVDDEIRQARSDARRAITAARDLVAPQAAARQARHEATSDDGTVTVSGPADVPDAVLHAAANYHAAVSR